MFEIPDELRNQKEFRHELWKEELTGLKSIRDPEQTQMKKKF